MVLLLLSPVSFFAQNKPQREHLPKEQNPQIQIKRLTLALNLTDDQANLVESLFENTGPIGLNDSITRSPYHKNKRKVFKKSGWKPRLSFRETWKPF